MIRNSEYSEKEQRLFTHFGYDDLLMTHIDPLGMYRLAVTRAFISNEQGPWADSLRRCIQAMETCRIYRMTPEWDAMIECEEDQHE